MDLILSNDTQQVEVVKIFSTDYCFVIGFLQLPIFCHEPLELESGDLLQVGDRISEFSGQYNSAAFVNIKMLDEHSLHYVGFVPYPPYGPLVCFEAVQPNNSVKTMQKGKLLHCYYGFHYVRANKEFTFMSKANSLRIVKTSKVVFCERAF